MDAVTGVTVFELPGGYKGDFTKIAKYGFRDRFETSQDVSGYPRTPREPKNAREAAQCPPD